MQQCIDQLGNCWSLSNIQNGESRNVQKPGKRFPPPSATRQQLEIPVHWRVTQSGRQFFMYNNLHNFVLIFCTEDNLRQLANHSVWCMEGAFKIVPEWYQQMFTIHVFKASKLIPLVYRLTVRKDVATYCEIFDNLISKATAFGVVLQPQTVICDFETALIPAVQGSFPAVNIQGCYIHFCPAVLRKVAEPGLQTRYFHEAERRKKIKMLMETAFLPLPEVPAAVDLLGRNVTGSVATWYDYFRREWMTPKKLTLWNVYNVQSRTNNEPATDISGKVDQLVTSGCVAAADLQIRNYKYEKVKQRITALTAEYDNATRTMEQLLRAVTYDVPEAAPDPATCKSISAIKAKNSLSCLK
ncbi:hypothetical protein T11_9676 [Trichinella zimbabwensis]|uniref:MULE transposase domain-containing protein n=1 Tax=Trichinella zimbabwensis TaxID=268475 RepID=A0A0V1GST1_9BILA|nr:hypothetical protein T11_9676 [Trichinella zimbabwensis]